MTRWIWLLFIAASTAVAQTEDIAEEKSLRVIRTDTRPVIDGRLDEAIWATADVVDDFHEVRPIEFDAPSQRTQVFVLYDQDYLYVAAKLWDEQPEEITAQILRQGSNISADDYFGVILDPFHDQRSGYLFQVNPNGVRAEAIYENTTQTQANWEGIWEASASVVDDGWVAEMAIPYKTLSFDPSTEAWGINFTRRLARSNETIGWLSRTQAQNPGVAGVANGFSGLEQGRGLDIVPSVAARTSKQFAPNLTNNNSEPSLDIFYKFTPAVTGVLTLNTDFSATEVDDRQVNLTRFSLFFPEKRDFFLQDADIFEFGGIGGGNNLRIATQNGRPFFSRNIGLSASREPVDLDVGAKLTGRVGDWNFGALSVQQDKFGDIDATNVFVGRAVRNVLEQSRVGFIMTDGDPQSNSDNSLAGFDFRYLNSRLPGGRTLDGDAWVQRTDTPGLEGSDSAFGLGFQLGARSGFSGNANYTEIQSNFNPALGFVNRPGIREVSGGIGYLLRPRDSFVRGINTNITVNRSERLADGSLQSESLRYLVGVVNHTGDLVRVSCRQQKEGIVTPFTVLRRRSPASNVVIDPGSYEFNSCSGELITGSQRKFSGRISYERGDFYDGERVSTRPNISWRPSSRFALNLAYQVNEIEVPEGAFTTRLTQLTTEVVFSSTLSWVNLIQWDNGSDVLGINSRLHWIPQAGRNFYFVLNHSLQDLDENGTFHSLGADLTAKASYTFRF
jgi:hypothetical protein